MNKEALGLGEGFDLLINRSRYITYFLMYNVGITVVTFFLSFFYFASRNPNIMLTVKNSLKYGLYSLKFWLFGNLDSFTAEIISKLIGQTQIELPNKNNFSSPKISKIDGINLHKERTTEVAVLPSEVMALRDLEFYAKFSRRWYKGKLVYIDIPKGDVEFFMKNSAFNLNANARNKKGDPYENAQSPTDTSHESGNSKAKNNTRSKSLKDAKEPQRSDQDPLDIADKFME